MTYSSDPLLGRLLKDVSRSFYLTLRLLPGVIRPQIGLAYLLARTSDTIADTGIIPLPKRLNALESLRAHILSHQSSPLNFSEFGTHQASAAERTLLERVNESLGLLERFADADQACIREVLTTILSGQELDLRRFADAGAQKVVALENQVELDDYTYRVAGCVGKFWTLMLRDHVLRNMFASDSSFLENGVRFGKGLQLVNILRDLPADLRQGRCYLPRNELSTLGLQPNDLLNPENETRFRPCYDNHLCLAESHLNAGWKYTLALPWYHVRLRIACALPLIIGFETVHLLRHGKILSGPRIKVSRSKVWRSLIGLFVFYPWGGPWRRMPQ